MVKQVINVGIQGNDATGDAIRDAFQKTNENFNELYSVIGQGDGISFTALTDVPDDIEPNKILAGNSTATSLIFKTITSGDGISIDTITDPTSIIINNTGANLSADSNPALGGNLNANGFAIGNLGDPTPTAAAALGVTEDTLAISKGYADNRYINTAGDTMAGALNVPANASGTQVPQKQEVVGRAGGSTNQMLGPLLLDADPTETSNPLSAATKNYVDTSSFSSTVNLYVSTNGSDFRSDVIETKRGRALAYAFRTINRACQYAESIINSSEVDLGPYEKPIFYDDGASRSLVSSINLISGTRYTLRITHSGSGTDPRKGANYDIRAGNLIKGVSSGGIVRILEVGIIDTVTDVFVVEYINNSVPLVNNEQLSYGSTLKKPNICIFIESGTYEEHLPIRVSENVSIVGDDMRRVLIKPKSGPSASIYSNIHFRRDTTIDVESLLTVGTTTFGYHYLTNPSVKLYTGTITNSGNFPNAQAILKANKEFIQEEVIGFVNTTYPSLSYDDELCKRDVGLIIDAIQHDLIYGGYTKALEAGISYFANASGLIAITTQKTETLAALNHAKNLALRIIQKLPISNAPAITSYQTEVTQVTEFDFVAETEASTAITHLMALIDNIIDEDSSFNFPKNNEDQDVFLLNNATIVTMLTGQGHGGFMTVLDPEGQIITKSPYTHNCVSFTRSINDQIFAGGMYVDGFCGNLQCTVTTRVSSTEIDVTGLNYRAPQTPCAIYRNGVRFLVDYITDYNPTTGVATLFLNPSTPDTTAYHGFGSNQFTTSTAIELQTAGNVSMVTNNYTQINDLGYGLVATNNGLIEAVSVFTYYCHAAYYALNGGQIRSLNGSCAYGVTALKAEGADPNEIPDSVDLVYGLTQVATAYTQVGYPNLQDDLVLYVTNTTYTPLNRSEIEIDHTGSGGEITRYEVASATTVGMPPGVVKLNLGTTGNNNTATTGLAYNVADGDPIIIRMGSNFLFENVANTNPIRPSTSLKFDNHSEIYRATSFSTAGLPSGQVLITTRENYAYIPLVLHSTAGTAGAGSGIIGDTVIRVIPLGAEDTSTVIGSQFAWGATLHTVSNYTPGTPYSTVAFSPALTKTTNGYGGPSPSPATLKSGLPAGAGAEITVRISTMRATSHDMLDIGTGSFADSNYPNNIFGEPNNPITESQEVREITSGRVFFTSTDQYGNFKVGDLFRVDQGTGTVTFAATIALSNLDGIGFKRGVTISEFSIDDSMTDNATDTVPVEQAVRGYIDKRLGLTHSGGVTAVTIGPGYIPRDGGLAATANISLGGNKITNLSDPTTNSDAANKSYVDNVLTRTGTIRTGVLTFTMAASNQINMNSNKIINVTDPTAAQDAATKNYVDTLTQSLDAIGGVTLSSPTSASLIAFTGTSNNAVNAAVSGDVTFTLAGNTLTAAIASGSIVNADINASAAIAQSKLNLNDATTGATVGEATKGIAAYNSTQFDVISGFVSLKSGAVNLASIQAIGNGSVLGNNSGLAAAPSEVSFATVVENGGALYNSLFSTNGAIVRTGVGSYGVVSYTSAATNNAIVQRDGSGGFNANIINSTQLNIDGNKAFDSSGTSPNQILEMFTPQGTLAMQTTGGSGAVSTTFSNSLTAGSLLTSTAAVSASAWTASGVNLRLQARTYTDTSSVAGTVPSSYINVVAAPTFASTNAITITDAANMFVAAPVAGTNTTITNAWSIFAAGRIRGSEVQTTSLTTGSNATAGTITGDWTLTAGSTFEATFADLAEYYEADKRYEPGTVLMIGGEKEVTAATIMGSTKVIGIVSTNPAFTMNADCGGVKTAVALQGRVPCKVIGKIFKGDLLIASGIPGVASASTDPKTGSVIGKALVDYDSSHIGVIEVVVGKH
jgi:hypothetical protein